MNVFVPLLILLALGLIIMILTKLVKKKKVN